jgi:hypothetical protein
MGILNGTVFEDVGWEDIPVAGKVLDPILDPKAPPNLADTPEAQSAATHAERVAQQQAGMAAPKPGTSGIPTVAPTKPIPPAPPPAPAQIAPSGTGVPDPTGAFKGLSANDRYAAEQQRYDAELKKYNEEYAKYQADLAAYEQYQRSLGGPAAQVTGPDAVGATVIDRPTLNFTPGVQAQQVNAPLAINPQQINAPVPVTTAGVAAPTGVTAGQVVAERIGPMAIEGAPADIDINGIPRDAQMRALGLAESAALGNAPSAAEALLRKGIDENIGAAMGIAATTQGRNPGLAMRAGLTSAQGAIAKSAADMAALRADEQAKGRALFMEAATGIRAQDISVAQSNQTKNLIVAQENLKAKIDTAKANQDAALRAGLGNQAAALQADIATMNAQLSAAQTTAELSLRADIANMTASLDASKANQAADLNAQIASRTNEIEVAKANQRAALEAGIANQAAELEAQIRQMQAQLDADKSNQAALLDAAKANAANKIQTNYQNATLSQQQDQFRAGREGDVLTANQRAALEQQAINNQLYLGMTNAATNALGVPLGVAAGDVARQTAYQQGQQQFAYSLAGALGGAAIGGPAGAATGANVGKAVAPGGTTAVPPPSSYYKGDDTLIDPYTGKNGAPILDY